MICSLGFLFTMYLKTTEGPFVRLFLRSSLHVVVSIQDLRPNSQGTSEFYLEMLQQWFRRYVTLRRNAETCTFCLASTFELSGRSKHFFLCASGYRIPIPITVPGFCDCLFCFCTDYCLCKCSQSLWIAFNVQKETKVVNGQLVSP